MTSSKNWFGLKSACAALFLFLGIAPDLGWAQSTAPVPLPSAAQEALDKGVIAAKVPDYLLAIRFFEEARKTAPDAPIVYLNLGLAESKISGRELRAISWFGAYLAAYPDAPDAAAVKEQIAALHVTSLRNVSRLIKSVQDEATKLPVSDRDSALQSLPLLWAKVGDLAAAFKTVDLIRDKSYALQGIAEAQAGQDDFDGAQKTVEFIEKEWVKSESLRLIAGVQIQSGDRAGGKRSLAAAQKSAASISGSLGVTSQDQELSWIASDQAEADDIAGAQTTAGLIQSERYRIEVLAAIATAQARNGNLSGAQKSLAAAMQTAGLTKDVWGKSIGLAAIAKAQRASGDIASARKTIISALNATDLIYDTQATMMKDRSWSDIAQVQARSGDIPGAQKTFERMSSGARYRSETLIAIVKAQINARDLSGARKTAKLADDQFTKGETQQLIAIALASKSPTKAPSLNPQVSAWLSKLDDANPYSDCPLNTAPFLDLIGFLKALPPSDVVSGTKQTARSIAWAQNVVDQMLKRQGLQ